MRKKKNEGVFIAKANRKKENGIVFTAEVNKAILDGKEFIRDLSEVEKTKIFRWETYLDYVISAITRLIENIKERPESDSLKKKTLDYLIEMREFFSTRVSSLKISGSLDDSIPYKYDVAYRAVADEAKAEIEQKTKEYIHSQLFNIVMAQVDPRVMDLLREKEELLKKELELAKREAELKKKEKKAGKFKRSGHLTDQILQYNYPVGKSKQLGIFDKLNQSILEKIEQSGIEKKEIGK